MVLLTWKWYFWKIANTFSVIHACEWKWKPEVNFVESILSTFMAVPGHQSYVVGWPGLYPLSRLTSQTTAVM